jgi:hypothetical protein
MRKASAPAWGEYEWTELQRQQRSEEVGYLADGSTVRRFRSFLL